jgi:hypothetical protein
MIDLQLDKIVCGLIAAFVVPIIIMQFQFEVYQ